MTGGTRNADSVATHRLRTKELCDEFGLKYSPINSELNREKREKARAEEEKEKEGKEDEEGEEEEEEEKKDDEAEEKGE